MVRIFELSLVDVLTWMMYGLTLISIIAVIFFERKNASSTFAWILVLSFLPLVGLVLYFFLGRGLKLHTRRKLRIRREMHEKYGSIPAPYRSQMEATKAVLERKEFSFHDPAMKRYADLVRLNYTTGNALFSPDNHIDIYTSAVDKYTNLFDDIDKAEHSIHLFYFIFSNDQIGHALIDLLAEKAEQGVTVRLIYDELGSFATPYHIFKKLKDAGGEVYRFFPLRPGSILRANYRNHHKIAVIDGKIAYTGGMNIGKNYLGLHRQITPWRDTHVRITGGAVSVLQFLFLSDLFYATEDENLMAACLTPEYFRPIKGGDVSMQIVASGPDTHEESIKRGLTKMIDKARKKIYIQSPYFMPDQPVLEALQNAAASGIEVLVMLPGVPDKKMVYTVTVSYIEQLLDYGIQVYLYRGFMHAKMMVVDDEICTIGTTNMDMRSFSLHFEVNAFIYDTSVAVQCRDIFLRDLRQCDLVRREEYDRRGLFRKFMESILRLFAPLM